MAMRSRDRVLVLEKLDPKDKDMGLIDPKVLTGDNRLRAVSDDHCYWTFKYDKGMLPEPLKERFTDFKTAKQHAERYFALKRIKITEVLD